MSLSWKDEQCTPANSGEFFGKDMKLDPEASYHATPAVTQAPQTPCPQKGKKKCWVLRPIAWAVLLASVYLMNGIINTGVLLGAYVVDWLSTLPKGAVIVITLALGGVVLSLLIYGVLLLPTLIMAASHAIYPSKNGVRFYVIGTWQILLSLFSVVLALADTEAAHALWDCAIAIYFAVVYIFWLHSVKSIIEK